MKSNTNGKQVCVVVGATSKWQSDGRNTLLAHGHTVDDSELPVGVRWGVGGRHRAEIRERGFLCRADDPQRGQCSSTGQGYPRAGAANA